MNKNKNDGLEQILKQAGQKATKYKPKAKVRVNTTRHKSKKNVKAFNITRVSKNRRNIFAPKESNKKHQYGVMRVRRPVVKALKVLQAITGDKSRSQLLSQMIEYCKPAILNNKKKKKQYRAKMHK